MKTLILSAILIFSPIAMAEPNCTTTCLPLGNGQMCTTTCN